MSRRDIHIAPPGSADPVLGRTLAGLLDEACSLDRSTPAVAERISGKEVSLSARELRIRSDQLAGALLHHGLERGDRVVLCMPPGIAFTIIDFACQIAGIIDIPLYESCREEDLAFIIDETEAAMTCVGGQEASAKMARIAKRRTSLKLIMTTDHDAQSPTDFGADHVLNILFQDEVEHGKDILKRSPGLPAELRSKIKSNDIATLIYTSGTTGKPKGVQLTQENISFNGMTGFADIRGLNDETEVAMSLLPLAHVFQRTMHYASIAHGWPIHFATPAELKDGIRWARPTIFAAVPRVLEKIREGISIAGSQRTGLERKIFDWSMALAEKQEIGRKPGLIEALQLKIADTLVYSKWRAAVGGQLKVVVCGGAALNPKIANFFSAWGVDVLQGFGLTETSTIVTFNRKRRNRAGTVGHPLPGVEVAIAEDGEILTRGPHVTSGYYNRPDATREAIDEDGWFHTGDIGEFDDDGFLIITDRKKNLFKLSTGRYIAPQPMEMVLTSDPLVNHALITGIEKKFPIALIFPEETTLRNWIKSKGIRNNPPLEEVFAHPLVIEKYQQLLDIANTDVAEFHRAKAFKLIDHDLTVENGMLTPTMKVRRTATSQQFKTEIELTYTNALRDLGRNDLDI